jgi:hypothetical protein
MFAADLPSVEMDPVQSIGPSQLTRRRLSSIDL